MFVDGIASHMGLGAAFSGMLLLGGITSLPEIATVSTAAWTGNPSLAVNNLLGSAAINVLLLAVADAAIGRDALTSVVAKPSTLLQGTLGMLLLTTVAIAATVGDVAVVGLGAWTTALFLLCVAAARTNCSSAPRRPRSRRRWRPSLCFTQANSRSTRLRSRSESSNASVAWRA